MQPTDSPCKGDSPTQNYLQEYAGLVEACTKPGTEDPDVAATTTDHGGMPSPVHGRIKREPGTPGEPQQLNKTRRLTSPHKMDRCCNCTSGSTCVTKRCSCRKAERHCIDCVCISKCSNSATLLSSCDSGKPNVDDKAEGARVTPRNLNFQDDGEDESMS